jgi:hypothetical protein
VGIEQIDGHDTVGFNIYSHAEQHVGLGVVLKVIELLLAEFTAGDDGRKVAELAGFDLEFWCSDGNCG